jgi:ribosomal protein S27AE
MTTRMILPLEERNHATPCRACRGLGVTGQRYEMQTDSDVVLLLEVFCPACGGCGNGDPEHGGCKATWHAEPDDGDAFDYDDLDDEDFDDADGPPCPSCGSGRGWFPIQGFDDAEVYTLRGLCGCSTPRLVEVTE